MSPILVNAAVTLALLTLTGALLGATGTYYLVTTAGLPHFIIGFVFAALAVWHGRPQRRRMLGALAALSVLACALYMKFPIPDLVGAYFVVHMFRDEVYMYLSRRASFDPVIVGHAGDTSPTGGETPRDLHRAWIAGRILIVVALAAFLLGRLAVSGRGRWQGGLFADPAGHLTGSTPLDLLVAIGLVLLLAVVSLTSTRLLSFLQLPKEAREFLTLFVVVAFAAHLREATLFLATFHYVSWYLFYGEKLRARQQGRTGDAARLASDTGFWRTVMNRPRPFTALMVTANLIAVAGVFLYLRYPTTLRFLAGGYEYAFFPYWTIPHVTLSFLPRR